MKKIISGAQTGADMGALIAAKKMGLETGGAMPRGFRTEDGVRADIGKEFNMRELSSQMFPPRTYANVGDSDGTLCISKHWYTPGTKCTLRAVKELKKPVFKIDTSFFDIASVVDWIVANNIQVLNVAGNRETKCPGIQATTEKFITDLIEAIQKIGV